MNINNRLKSLRQSMEKNKVDAYIVNTADPHHSEYIADYYKSRVWISGFTGSAGTVVVTQKDAILWTDGRYFVQAENELSSSDFELYKMNTPGYPNYSKWLKDNLKNGDTIGFQGDIFSQASFEEIVSKMEGKDLKFNGDIDLIGPLWEDRPKLKKGKVFVHDVKYAGKTSSEKLHQVREEMKKQSLDYHLLGSLDDIAWLFNIRGNDVEYNPVHK